MKLFSDSYRGRRILITGHTGFKGSWLALWLHKLGAIVTGVALPPESKPNHWDFLQLPIDDHRVDIPDMNALRYHDISAGDIERVVGVVKGLTD